MAIDKTRTALLDSQLRAEAINSIESIITDVRRIGAGSLSAIAHGELALLFTYTWLQESRDEWRDLAVAHLENAIEESRSVRPHLILHGGILDVAWLITHTITMLSNTGSYPLEVATDPLSDLDEVIYTRQRHDSRYVIPTYDLICGQVGIGVYWLERMPGIIAFAGIKEVLVRLAKSAEGDNDCLKWFTPPELIPTGHRADAPYGYYNLGMAHGIAGIVAFLARVIREGADSDGIGGHLLRGAVQWLLEQERNSPEASIFPTWVLRESSYDTDSRLGWCYGDLGIACALEMASACLPHRGLDQAACKLLDHNISRPFDKCSVRDAMLCHGAFGIAHIYNKMYQRFGSSAYCETAKHWYKTGFRFRDSTDGIGGFSPWFPSHIQSSEFALSMLNGSIGAALVLMAAVSGIEPQWDRRLLLSCRSPISDLYSGTTLLK